MVIYYYARFRQQYKKLPKEIKYKIAAKEAIFKINPFDPRLETHKLHGESVGLLAFSITNKYRVVFDFLNKNIARFYEIGTHDIYN